MSNEHKMFLNLAGEFAVASELNRRRILASVTYGASKSADVFALSRGMRRVLRVEVKTTDKMKWPIGDKATRLESNSDDVIWVFVLLPAPLNQKPKDDSHQGRHAPRFFILSAKELHAVWWQQAEEYLKRYRLRHGGKEFTGRGVPNVRLEGVEPFEGQWQKIVSRLES